MSGSKNEMIKTMAVQRGRYFCTGNIVEVKNTYATTNVVAFALMQSNGEEVKKEALCQVCVLSAFFCVKAVVHQRCCGCERYAEQREIIAQHSDLQSENDAVEGSPAVEAKKHSQKDENEQHTHS